ncbi:MAG: magnesium chelatase subunit H [Desulfosoma sp.]
MHRDTLTFVVNAALTEAVWEGVRHFRERFSRECVFKVFSTQDVDENAEAARRLEESLRSSHLVFLDLRGGGRTAAVCARVLPLTSQPVVLLLGGSPETLRLLRLGSFSLDKALNRSSKKRPSPSKGEFNLRWIQTGMQWTERIGRLLPFGPLKHARNWVRMMRYWQEGGAENIALLIAFAAKEYLGHRHLSVPGPVVFPDHGLYNFAFQVSTSNGYRLEPGAPWTNGIPSVGLLFYGGMHFSQSLIPTEALAKAFMRKGMAVRPVFAKTGHNLAAMRHHFMKDGRSTVGAVVYLQWFQLVTFTADSPQDAIGILKDMNVPIFAGCPMYGGEVARWEESERGLSPVEILTTVVLPELDGMIEPIPTAGLKKESDPEGMTFKRVVPLEDRIDRVAERVRRWIVLQHKADAEKRVAFVVYDNPPGEDNLGSAAYLDTFRSLEKLFREMQRRGFSVSGLPEEGTLGEYLLKKRLVNSSRWTDLKAGGFGGVKFNGGAYQEILEKLPPAEEVNALWGRSPGRIMTDGRDLFVPVLEFGNVLLGVQPVRGFHEDPDKIGHDKTVPPHHQYVAFYRWLEEIWQADCVVHVGTHGTLEFLKGKEVGVSRRCFPEALIGNLPHLYFYHVVNASEATIAKRRSLGVLINYNSPAFTVAGLYDDYEVLERLIEEYLEAQMLHPDRAQRLEKRLFEKARALELSASDVASLQEELFVMKRTLIPCGLHVLGESVGEDERMDFAVFFLRYDRDGCPSLHRLIAQSRGLDYDMLLSGKGDGAGGPHSLGVLEEIEGEVRRVVRRAWTEKVFPDDPLWRAAVEKALDAVRKLDARLEYENFFRALRGGYVEPGLGGDPLRNPEALPTGRNSFQFDPRLVPSEEAMRRGLSIAEKTLEHFRAEQGAYPRSVAVILWGFETTKTRGETVAQVLGYLGVRIAPDGNPYHKKLEPIPLEELGRPRVDCLVQICGFFRDMYPNVLDLLHRAFQLVSQLDEPPEHNFVRDHTDRIRQSLEDVTADEEEREHLAVGRIFGPRAGEYGTRVTTLIESGAWKDEQEIASLFMTSMQHLYGGALHGRKVPELYKESVRRVELVSQIRDSHEYEIMDLDHYYEFFGGLCRSVEMVRGVPPVMLISDTTKEVVRTENVKAALERGVRTRLLNPKWIEGLLAHHFHGAQKIADRVENLIGFAATTHAVGEWIWSRLVDRYARDDELFRRMAENNRFAMEQILARLLEAKERGYWSPTDEEEALIRDRYLELEGIIEERMEL